MPAIDIGADVAVSWKPGATAATVALAVHLPDGSTLDPAPEVTEIDGVYCATIPTTLAGRYLLNWTLSAGAPANAYTDTFDVWPSDPRFLIPLAEMVSALRSTTTVSASDQSDMRLFIAAATPIIEDIVGAVLADTRTQFANGGKTGITLWERPTAVASVTVNGTVWTVETQYVVDENAGIIYAGSRQAPGRFPPGQLNIEVIYSIGAGVIKPNIRLATIELVRHLWQLGRQGQGAKIPGAATPEMGYTPTGFAVPKRVIQLCAPDARKDGL